MCSLGEQCIKSRCPPELVRWEPQHLVQQGTWDSNPAWEEQMLPNGVRTEFQVNWNARESAIRGRPSIHVLLQPKGQILGLCQINCGHMLEHDMNETRCLPTAVEESTVTLIYTVSIRENSKSNPPTWGLTPGAAATVLQGWAQQARGTGDCPHWHSIHLYIQEQCSCQHIIFFSAKSY